MNNVIYPLKQNWRIDEDSSVDVQTQIKERVNSEDNYTNCKGYPLIPLATIKKITNK